MSTLSKEQIAQVAHETNRAYCQAMGDTSQLPWEDAPEWQKSSALKGVEHIQSNPDAKPEDSHNSWMKQKEEEGWRHGPVKNPETKEHPSFLPYDQLPASEKAKDYIFGAVVRTLSKL